MAGTDGRPMNHYAVFATARGIAAVATRGRGVAALCLPSPNAADARGAILRRVPDGIEAQPTALMSDVVQRVQAYFCGEQVTFDDVPVDLGKAGDVYTRIYAAVRSIRWGETMTYGAVAAAIGAGPEMARTVGQAMGHNPVPLIIPCHRVLAAGGRLGGFSAPGGSDTKVHMLGLESVIRSPATDDVQPRFAF